MRHLPIASLAVMLVLVARSTAGQSNEDRADRAAGLTSSDARALHRDGDVPHWVDRITGPESGPLGDGCDDCDLDGDLDVDHRDFAAFQRAFDGPWRFARRPNDPR